MNTVQIITPSGVKVAILEHQTARLELQLKRLFMQDTSINMQKLAEAKQRQDKGEQVNTSEIAIGGNEQPATLLVDAEEITLKAMVKSVGDVTEPEAVYEALLDMSPEDYKYVVDQINERTGGINEKKS